MTVSALKDVFREYELGYTTQTGTGTDADGNVTETGTPATLTVLFRASTADQLRPLPGADPRLIRGTGRLLSPSTFPTGVGIGSEFTMTYQGVAGTLRITNATPYALEILDSVLGVKFVAEWRPL